MRTKAKAAPSRCFTHGFAALWTGFVPKHHLAEVTLKKPERKFLPGSKVQGRVLMNKPGKLGTRAIILTLKKVLLPP
jgi:ribosomal protein S1